MAALLNVSERDKVDDILRLPGLNFPKCKRVIGNKHTPLLLALGAISTHGGRAGNQLAVIKRLSLLFKAVIFTQDDCDTLDLASDGFYGAAMHTIAVAKPDMAEHLTPETLRLVIDLYTQAFARSGWKVIKKPTKSPNGGEEDADAIKKTTEILEPIDHIDDCIKLEQLVKEWMRARGIARQSSTSNKKPVFHLFEVVNVPQQKPNETLYTYLARLQNDFRKLQRGGEADAHVQSYISDQRLQRIGQLSEENEEYEGLLDKRLQLLDKKQDVVDGYKRLLEQSRERLDKKDDLIRHYQDLAEQRRKRIDQYLDEISESKIRITSMQQAIDQYGDMLDNHEDLVSVHAELDQNLTLATEMQAEIMKLELDAANIQHDVNYKLDEVRKGHDVIAEMRNELSQEVQRTSLMQDSIADSQAEVFRRQAQIMTRQMNVMDGVRAMLNRYHQG